MTWRYSHDILKKRRSPFSVLRSPNLHRRNFSFLIIFIVTALVFSACPGPGGGTPFVPQYRIGDTGPGGGKIFYVDPNGFTVEMIDPAQNYTAHYLEAAPTDMTSLAWASSVFIPPANGGTGNWIDITGTAMPICTGRKNTALILAIDINAPAAKACITPPIGNGTFTDWFLPSFTELFRLWENRDLIGNLGTNNYWSSTQINSVNVYSEIFSNGFQSVSSKYQTYTVRAIRAF